MGSGSVVGAKAPACDGASGWNLHALVVDRSDQIRRMVREFFGTVGIDQVEGVETTDVALERLHAVRYDLVTSAWDTRPESGLELLQTVRREESLRKIRHIPFIIITGESSPAYIAAAYSSGANGYLTKPVSLSDFRRVVLQALGLGRTATTPSAF